MAQKHGPRNNRRRSSVLVLLVAITPLFAACYLPSQTTPDRPVEELVRITVSTCADDSVGGGAHNAAEVPVRVGIRAKWLDSTSTLYHEEQTEIDQLLPDEQVQWETTTDDELETPVFCEAEAQRVEVLE